MKIKIKSWRTGSVLFEGDLACIADAVSAAVRARTNLSNADLYGADLSCANLSGADLYGADLSGANLSRANLSFANLSGADLSRADLSRADLSRANLSFANLSFANLSGADLSFANLSGADLYGADLSGANLSRANLSGANLYNYAQVAFRGHGECGRMLTAIVEKDGTEPRLFCGCFTGSFAELERYIAEGEERYRASRTLAMNMVKQALEINKETK